MAAYPVEPFKPPYPPSWVNLLNEFAAQLPGASWMYYLGFWIVLFAVTTLIQWNEHAYPVGTFNIFHLALTGTIAVVPLYIRYLSRTAEDALEGFRVALQVNDEQYQKFRYALTVLPGRATFAWGLMICVLTLAQFLISKESQRQLQMAMTPLSLGWAAILFAAMSFAGGAWLYQILRQMRLVNHLYRETALVDLFDPIPLYGFSGLQARAALGVILLICLFFVLVPNLFFGPLTSAYTLLGLGMAGAVFVLPLLGMHNRMVREKAQLLGQVGKRIRAAMTALHRQADSGDAANAMETKELLAGLEIEQRLVEKIPTWPWQPETLRIIVTALILPIVLFLIQFLLQQFFK